MIRKYVIGMAAAAVVLCGFNACGNKADAEKKADAESVAQTLAENNETAPENVEPAAAAPDFEAMGYTSTPSGLKYKVIKEGNGIKPSAVDNVTVHYEGKFVDGTVFDSSYERGEPTTFPLNRVIPGWTEGVQLMPEGSVYEFYIPYDLAYGERGAAPVIPPKADLIFTVELIKVEK